MIIDFKGLLDEMEDTEIFAVANDARPGSDYLLASVLPEVKRRGYSAKSSKMRIKSTMAKLVAMDSPYPRSGVSERSGFEHALAKMAVEMPFPEAYLRELRELVQDLLAQNVDGKEQLVETMFNFTDKLLVQPHLDTAEWLRGQAIFTGAIDWECDGIHLEVDYGIPDGNFLTARTGSDAYGGATSKFWTDWHAAQRILKNRVTGVLMRTETLQTIMYNPVNGIKVVSADDVGGIFKFQRVVAMNGVNVVSDDARDNITVFVHDGEGEVLDETLMGTGATKVLPFVPVGAIGVIGKYDNRQFVVGTGSTPDPTPIQLGYTHVGPTEEGNGRLGRWANAYVPQGQQWQFIGQSAANVLPVIDAPERIVIMTTEVV